MDDRVFVDLARNAATNGRLFCLMIFAVNLVAFAIGYGPFYAKLAILSAVPVGLSVIADRMSMEDHPRVGLLSLVITALSVLAAVLTFFAAW